MKIAQVSASDLQDRDSMKLARRAPKSKRNDMRVPP